MKTSLQNEDSRNLKLFVTIPGMIKIILKTNSPAKISLIKWVVDNLLSKMHYETSSRQIVPHTTSLAEIDSFTVKNIKQELRKFEIHRKQDFEQIRYDIAELISKLKLSFTATHGSKIAPHPFFDNKSSTISEKLDLIQSRLVDTAKRAGVHPNIIYNEFKKHFKLRSYRDLDEKDYNKAHGWISNLQDKIDHEQEKKRSS